MRRLAMILSLAAAACAMPLASSRAWAQSECVRLLDGRTACPPPDSRCVKDRYGDWHCSQPGGDARLDLHGNPVCGTGACVVDINGTVQCSTQSRGAASMDMTSRAVCAGGCAPASAQLCGKLTP